jgi:hypothetical protein
MVASNQEKERNRLRLRAWWLTFQSCSFRGHDETPQFKNRGNFLEILKLLAEFNPEIASVVLATMLQKESKCQLFSDLWIMMILYKNGSLT